MVRGPSHRAPPRRLAASPALDRAPTAVPSRPGARVRVVGGVAAAGGAPLAVGALRARRDALRGLHAELVAAARADVGACTDVASGGNGLGHGCSPRRRGLRTLRSTVTQAPRHQFQRRQRSRWVFRSRSARRMTASAIAVRTTPGTKRPGSMRRSSSTRVRAPPSTRLEAPFAAEVAKVAAEVLAGERGAARRRSGAGGSGRSSRARRRRTRRPSRGPARRARAPPRRAPRPASRAVARSRSARRSRPAARRRSRRTGTRRRTASQAAGGVARPTRRRRPRPRAPPRPLPGGRA